MKFSTFIEEWVLDPAYTWRRVGFAWERVKKGVSGYDACDLDFHIAKVVSNGLRILEKNRSSLGESFVTPEIARKKKENVYYECTEEEEKLWHENMSLTLLTMADYFDLLAHFNHIEAHSYYDVEGVAFKKRHKEHERIREEVKDEAFRLLSKHFFDLWD